MLDSKGYVQGSQPEMCIIWGPTVWNGKRCRVHPIEENFFKARDVEIVNQIPSTPQIEAVAPRCRLEIR